MGAPTAAWRHSNGDVLRPLVLEWRNITAAQPLTVQLGSTLLTVSLTDMRLPLPVLAARDARLVGAAGHYSRVFYSANPAPPDAPGLVLYDVSLLPAVATFSNSMGGLDFAVKSYGGVAAGAVRYAVAIGYLTSPVKAKSALVRVTWMNPGGQGVTLVAGGAGGVTIRNGGNFMTRIAAGAAAESFSYDIYMVPGLMRLAAIVKSKAAGTGVVFSGALAVPVAAGAAVGASLWSSAVDQQLQT